MPNTGAYLRVAQPLQTNDWLQSANGHFHLGLKGDASFGVFRGLDPDHAQSPPLWSSQFSKTQDNYVLLVQSDGNLVVHRGTPTALLEQVWSLSSIAKPLDDYFAWLQDDGTFGIYQGSPDQRGYRIWCNMVEPMDYNLKTISLGDAYQANSRTTADSVFDALDAHFLRGGQTDIVPAVGRRNLGLLGSPGVMGTLAVLGHATGAVGAAANGATELLKLIEGGQSGEMEALASISKQISDLQLAVLDGFREVDLKLLSISKKIDWTYALGAAQPPANFIANAWDRFAASLDASEAVLDEMAKQMADQVLGNDLESELITFYNALMGPDLVAQPDLGLINIFVRQTWEREFTDSRDLTAWATDLAIFLGKIQRVLIDGITMHLWAIGRRRPDRYAVLRSTYKNWLATIHKMAREGIPAPLSSMFDPTLWTNYNEQQSPLYFKISSPKISNSILTSETDALEPVTSFSEYYRNRAVMVDSEGNYGYPGHLNAIPDFRERASFALRRVPGEPLLSPQRLTLSQGRVGKEKYIRVPGPEINNKFFCVSPDVRDPMPADVLTFKLVSTLPAWADRMTFQLSFGTLGKLSVDYTIVTAGLGYFGTLHVGGDPALDLTQDPGRYLFTFDATTVLRDPDRDPLPPHPGTADPPLTYDSGETQHQYGPVIRDRLRYSQFTLLSNVFNNFGLLSAARPSTLQLYGFFGLTSRTTHCGPEELWQVLKVGEGGTIVDAFHDTEEGREYHGVNCGDRIALRSGISGLYLSGNFCGSGHVGVRDVLTSDEVWRIEDAYSERPGEPLSQGEIVKLQMAGAPSGARFLLSGEGEGGGVRTFFPTVGRCEAWMLLGPNMEVIKALSQAGAPPW